MLLIIQILLNFLWDILMIHLKLLKCKMNYNVNILDELFYIFICEKESLMRNHVKIL